MCSKSSSDASKALFRHVQRPLPTGLKPSSDVLKVPKRYKNQHWHRRCFVLGSLREGPSPSLCFSFHASMLPQFHRGHGGGGGVDRSKIACCKLARCRCSSFSHLSYCRGVRVCVHVKGARGWRSGGSTQVSYGRWWCARSARRMLRPGPLEEWAGPLFSLVMIGCPFLRRFPSEQQRLLSLQAET